MKNYTKYGFVNTKQMFADALKGHYAVPQYNFSTPVQLEAIIRACVQTRSPVIISVGPSERMELNAHAVMYLAQYGIELARDLEKGMKTHIPIAFHLDHGKEVQVCKDCVDDGFSSVMFDGSQLPSTENILKTKEVVQYAHKFDVTVEGELGVIAGIEDVVRSKDSYFTKPEEVVDFVSKTGVDSLAISIGTSHGAYKFKIKPGDPLPTLQIEILKLIRAKVPNFPLVLHGASSVPQEAVKTINKFGGDVENAMGIPESELKKAVLNGIVKVNVHSDSQLTMTAAIRKHFAENPKDFHPSTYLNDVSKSLMDLYINKNKNVLLCENRA
jgi:fructose-bisphosphate aldolase, class II